MAQEPSITREVSIVSSKGLTDDSPKPAGLSVTSSRKSRRSKTPRMPMFLNCPPNPPYTNYMDEEPTLKYYKERKLSHKEKYDYSSITKAPRLQCLTNLRYKTMDEIEAGEKSTYGKARKVKGAEEEECYKTEFITIPAPRYPPKSSQPTDQDIDTFSLPSANSQQPSNDLEDQGTADQACSKDNETIESYSDTSVGCSSVVPRPGKKEEPCTGDKEPEELCTGGFAAPQGYVNVGNNVGGPSCQYNPAPYQAQYNPGGASSYQGQYNQGAINQYGNQGPCEAGPNQGQYNQGAVSQYSNQGPCEGGPNQGQYNQGAVSQYGNQGPCEGGPNQGQYNQGAISQYGNQGPCEGGPNQGQYNQGAVSQYSNQGPCEGGPNQGQYNQGAVSQYSNQGPCGGGPNQSQYNQGAINQYGNQGPCEGGPNQGQYNQGAISQYGNPGPCGGQNQGYGNAPPWVNQGQQYNQGAISQYGNPGQQYGPQGQQCENQGQYGPQGQQYGGNPAAISQYGNQGQQYANQGQPCGNQGQQYGIQGQGAISQYSEAPAQPASSYVCGPCQQQMLTSKMSDNCGMIQH